jgi:LPXTG-motif cell wall-anchored protein
MSYVAVSPGSAPPVGLAGLGTSPPSTSPPAEKSNLPMIAGGLALAGTVFFVLRRRKAA